jgi:hypothetical protein
MCSAIIRELIANINLDILLSTRQFLAYGKRSAVDQFFYRMVKTGKLIRVARGIFVKQGSRWPTVLAIAAAKAKAFGKQIVQYAGDLSAHFEITAPPAEIVFAVSGSSSHFHCSDEVVYLKANASRKMLLDKTAFGQAVRAVWHRGKDSFDQACQSVLYQALQSFDRRQLPQHSALMPAWINDRIVG